MKRIIMLLLCIFTVAITFVSCGSKETPKNGIAGNSEMDLQKYAAELRERQKADSTARATARAEVINRYHNLFDVKNDEFSDYTWVKPKNRPLYTNRNGIYCYFAIKSGKPENFRLVFQYYADDWLFIKNFIFNIDGENIQIIPLNMETDCGYGGKIWEWCDESVSNIRITINEVFISKLANATTVKVKLNGSHYYKVITLTPAQIKTIKDTYKYYCALGGKF